ncbi:hypothetical protein, partial [Thiolapillus sp.]|uniref:hypothetical protein n=3 Tax=Thiolapillus sp. TaxID=2017437 RepID=UPI003AF8DE2E
GWITMALCFLQVLREPVVQYLAGSEQKIAPFWNIITWYPTPGWSYDFGIVKSGTYYFELSPEPVDGPKVDPDTGVHTVDDLTGPYNFLLRSTKLPPNGN